MDFSWSIGVDKDVENGIGLLQKSLDWISIQFAILLKEIVCCRFKMCGKDIKYNEMHLEIGGNEASEGKSLITTWRCLVECLKETTKNFHKNQIPKRRIK